MKAAVVYESMFGNTRRIAEAVADGLALSVRRPEVVVIPVVDATADDLLDLELLVVGGPTHLSRMTSRRTREMRAGSRAKSPSGGPGDPEELARAAATGVREWLASLSAVPVGRRAAAFDTRLRYLPAAGAAPLIARCLRSRGYRVDAVLRSFFVESAHGPLANGESERAKLWGAALGDQLRDQPCLLSHSGPAPNPD